MILHWSLTVYVQPVTPSLILTRKNEDFVLCLKVMHRPDFFSAWWRRPQYGCQSLLCWEILSIAQVGWSDESLFGPCIAYALIKCLAVLSGMYQWRRKKWLLHSRAFGLKKKNSLVIRWSEGACSFGYRWTSWMKWWRVTAIWVRSLIWKTRYTPHTVGQLWKVIILASVLSFFHDVCKIDSRNTAFML